MPKRRITFIVLLLFPALNFCQSSIGFSDSFSDGNLNNNPKWIGDTAKFLVNAFNQLQLNDLTASSPANLSTKSQAIYKSSWEFYLHLDFAPSSSNYMKVYLVSDHADLTDTLQGYFLKIGGISGSADDVSLYRQDGIQSQLIIDGKDGSVGSNPVDLKIKVTRDSIGNWELYTDSTGMGNAYVSEGTVFDDSYSSSRFFGLQCKYTSSRSDKFFFDDFLVQGLLVLDSTKPKLLNATALSDSALSIQFSEKVLPTALNSGNYYVDKGIGSAIQINYDGADSASLILKFSNRFANANNYQLLVSNVSDFSGNLLLSDSTIFTYFIPDVPSYRDVVINEIYPDFSPSNGLPEVEFVEIYNASSKFFDLNNWTISDASSSAAMPGFILHPGEYVILCPSGTEPDFSSFGRVLGLSAFPSLNNAGDLLDLKDDLGISIDRLSYTSDWYRNESKKEGGYSLEQINPAKHCTGAFNFRASEDLLGGTPGQQNSVFDASPDTIPPVLLSVKLIKSDSIHFSFNEFIEPLSLSLFQINFSNGAKMKSLSLIEPENQVLAISITSPLDSGLSIAVNLSGLADCDANSLILASSTIILPQSLQSGDLVINELLFNPKSGGSDFVEIYNRSSKVLDLQDLRIANYAGDSIANLNLLVGSQSLVFPGDYIVITEDANDIVNAYPGARGDRILEVVDLPSYNDDEGRVYLLNANLELIDYLLYSEDMHFPLLQNVEGVSLERLDPNRATNDNGNFHSAAETVGFASPGYQNSQYFASSHFSGKVNVDPELFSPDNDGYKDLLNINYEFKAPGYVANLRIYDDQGRLVRILVRNELLGAKGSFTWDGTNEHGEKARIGIYLIMLESFNINGDKEIFKKPCVLGGKL